MNLKALAQQLGLSQTTVSRALNGYPEVSEMTRQRVIKAARAINYHPNRNAKSLATGRTNHIGIIIPIEHHHSLLMEPVFGEFMAGISEFLAEADMDITIMPCKKADELHAYQRQGSAGRVDGIIVSSPAIQDPRIEPLIKSGFPFVLHGRTECNHPAPYLDIDNFGAFEKATQLLLDLGHTRIALINGDQSMTFARHRTDGYSSALKQQGIPFDPQLVYAQAGMSEEQGFSACIQLLQCRPQPTALIIGSMIHALGAKRAIRQQGLEPGRDIAVIAHDDELPYLQADKFDPPLTTTSSSIRAAGYAVTQLLQNEIQHQKNTHNKSKNQRVLDVDLIVRGSTPQRRPK